MKLLKKLIPLGTVAIAATTIAPIITSCANNLETYTLTNSFTPTIAQASESELPDSENYTRDDVARLYMKHVNANPDILIEDVLNTQTIWMPERLKQIQEKFVIDTNIISSNCEISMGNIHIDELNYYKGEEQKSIFTITMDLNYKFSYELMDAQNNKYKNDITFTSKYNKIPLYFNYQKTGRQIAGVDEATWEVCVWLENNEERLQYIPGWSFEYDSNEIFTSTIKDEEGNISTRTETYNDSNRFTRYSQYQAFVDQVKEEGWSFYGSYLDIFSYHLYNLNKLEPSEEGDQGILPVLTNDTFTDEAISDILTHIAENGVIPYFAFEFEPNIPEPDEIDISEWGYVDVYLTPTESTNGSQKVQPVKMEATSEIKEWEGIKPPHCPFLMSKNKDKTYAGIYLKVVNPDDSKTLATMLENTIKDKVLNATISFTIPAGASMTYIYHNPKALKIIGKESFSIEFTQNTNISYSFEYTIPTLNSF